MYEDNHLMAVFKPAGVLVQKDEGKGYDDNTLYWRVKSFIKKRDKKTGDVFLGVVHRLDRPVSGIVLFAKTSKGAARISEQIRDGKVMKIYHAVVRGMLRKSKDTLINYLQKDEQNKIAIISEYEKAGDYAEMDYEVIKKDKFNSLLKIRLKTGRFHQIRAQLAHIGHPILGDKKYGSSYEVQPYTVGEIALCATEIKFKKATLDEMVSVRIDWPEEWEELI